LGHKKAQIERELALKLKEEGVQDLELWKQLKETRTEIDALYDEK